MTATPDARPRGTRLPRLARRRQLLGAAQEVFVAQGTTPRRWTRSPSAQASANPCSTSTSPGKLELYLALLDEHAEALVRSSAKP